MQAPLTTYYIDEDDVRQYGFQPALNELNFVNAAIPRICEQIDLYVGVPTGYFNAVASSVAVSSRLFYGSDAHRLRIEPYHAGTITGSISAPSGITVPSYVEVRPDNGRLRAGGGKVEFFLEVVNSAGHKQGGYQWGNRDSTSGATEWVEGCPYTITARWGWAATPEAIKQAAIETLIAMHRGKDQAFMKVVNLETNTVVNNDPLPPRAKQILDSLRARVMFA